MSEKGSGSARKCGGSAREGSGSARKGSLCRRKAAVGQGSGSARPLSHLQDHRIVFELVPVKITEAVPGVVVLTWCGGFGRQTLSGVVGELRIFVYAIVGAWRERRRQTSGADGGIILEAVVGREPEELVELTGVDALGAVTVCAEEEAEERMVTADLKLR